MLQKMRFIIHQGYKIKLSEFVKILFLKKIVSCIPQYWILMAGEMHDYCMTEQVSICGRYVNNFGELKFVNIF